MPSIVADNEILDLLDQVNTQFSFQKASYQDKIKSACELLLEMANDFKNIIEFTVKLVTEKNLEHVKGIEFMLKIYKKYF